MNVATAEDATPDAAGDRAGGGSRDAAGDKSRDAAAAFCRREHPRLVGALSLYCGDPLVAEELAQEALLRACDRWTAVSAMDAPGAWVHRVAINLAGSHFRRRRAERRANARRGPDHPPSHADADGADAVAIRLAVAALPARQRAAVVLRFYSDLPVDQVAGALGVSEAAVRSLIQRAMATLRGEFGLAPHRTPGIASHRAPEPGAGPADRPGGHLDGRGLAPYVAPDAETPDAR